MGWTGRRPGVDRHPVSDRGHQPDHRHVAGPVVGTHGRGGRPYIAWLQSTAAEAAQTGAQAKAAAGAYQTAYASMVPPPLITANRAELTTLVANNFLGQNTGAIAQNEAEYLDMWIQDALGMDTYQLNSTGASAALPAQTAAPLVTSGSNALRGSAAASPADATTDAIVGQLLVDFAELFGARTTAAPTVATSGCDLARGGDSCDSRATPLPPYSRYRRRTTWACWAARPLVCS